MLLCAVCVVLLFGWYDARELRGQRPSKLPGEGVLPGSTETPRELPGESALPGDDAAADDLPGEDEIPGAPAAKGAEDQDQSAPIGGKAPILRLAFDGHTGIVRTMDIGDGGRTLVTAGEDKDVHVWRRTDIGDTGWLHRRTIRWPVTRGPRGLIYAAKLKGDLLAFAGYGAFGSRGEVRIVDAASGDLQQTLVDPQDGHLSNVVSLAWSPEKTLRLASVDMEGRLILWTPDATTGLWDGTTLVKVDERTYGAGIAAALTQGERRAFVPISFAGPNYLVAPRYVGPADNPKGYANWHLQRMDLQSGKSVLLSNLDHIKHVRSLSATDDGRILASCDWNGSIGLWAFGKDGSIAGFQQFKPSKAPIFIDLDTDGKRLLVGTEWEGEKDDLEARIRFWEVGANRPR